jgi:hypothetical protein
MSALCLLHVRIFKLFILELLIIKFIYLFIMFKFIFFFSLHSFKKIIKVIWCQGE